MSSVSSTAFTLSSSAIRSLNGSRRCGFSTATVSFGSGSRTRSFLALRSDDAAEATSRTWSMVGDQFGVGGQVAGLRPVGQVHGPLAGDAAPDHLGDQREQRRRQPAGHLQHGVQRVDRVGILFPEPRTRPSHIPIRQRLGELPQLVAGAGDVADVHRRGEVVAQLRRAWPGCSGPARVSSRSARCPSCGA